MSLVVPFYNEEACVVSTIDEAMAVLGEAGLDFEFVAVDDGSSDATPRLLDGLRSRHPRLRVLVLDTNSGQSAAFGTGIERARGEVVVLMDGDGQNDPRDVVKLLRAIEGCDAVCGYRASRKDTWRKRAGSRVANAVRDAVLRDHMIDAGCSVKAMRAAVARDLPLRLRGMHRFIPALLLMRGARIQQIAVNHRPRWAGRSKYTNFGRLFITIADLRAVRWMQKRHRRFQVKEQL